MLCCSGVRIFNNVAWSADPSGVHTMRAYLVLRDKVIKLLLAGVVRPLGPTPEKY